MDDEPGPIPFVTVAEMEEKQAGSFDKVKLMKRRLNTHARVRMAGKKVKHWSYREFAQFIMDRATMERYKQSTLESKINLLKMILVDKGIDTLEQHKYPL